MHIKMMLRIAALICGVSLVSGVNAQTKLPGEQRGLRSKESRVSTQITFANNSAQTVKLYWLNFEGKRVFYSALETGESLEQQTYLTHPWVVTDADGNAWSLHFAKTKPSNVRIIAPSQK
jgi:von Hippel-Lindau disease tumor supressor